MRKTGAFGAIAACVLCIASALAFIIGGVGSPQLIRPASAQQLGQITCSQMASLVAFTTLAQIVAAPPAPNRIFVCGMTISSDAASSAVTFQRGTGSNCATGTTTLGPKIQLPATSTFDDGAAVFRGFLVPAGQALCVTGVGAANATIYYGIQ